MTEPDFNTMNLKKLRQYILSHREDNEAFYTFVDRVDKEKNWINNPPLDSIEDMNNYPDFLEKIKKDKGRKTPEHLGDFSS
ncbi:hypothetical protein VB715_16385 [Crocosphaera sp. UHCC 0190]|uniref:DUF6887 family protein n=1 Tax=Crocosphaera sp. UHCC 0190 TaxID=3110246 RepID=UPI002B1F8C0E|nr:hypothetical protein [Crocosphaera sp. UHCC 0190]MEA5511353.1 hypothetical protein [Crocosphaera sp. UHCC 0190]